MNEWNDRGGESLGLRLGFEVSDKVDETRAPDLLSGPAAYLAEQVVAYAELGVAISLSVRASRTRRLGAHGRTGNSDSPRVPRI